MAEQKFLGEAGLDVLVGEVKTIKNGIGISPFEEWRDYTRKILGTYVNLQVPDNGPNIPGLLQKKLAIFKKILDNFMKSWDLMRKTFFADYNVQETLNTINYVFDFAGYAKGALDVAQMQTEMEECLSHFDKLWRRVAYQYTGPSYSIGVEEDLKTYDHVSWHNTLKTSPLI